MVGLKKKDKHLRTVATAGGQKSILKTTTATTAALVAVSKSQQRRQPDLVSESEGSQSDSEDDDGGAADEFDLSNEEQSGSDESESDGESQLRVRSGKQQSSRQLQQNSDDASDSDVGAGSDDYVDSEADDDTADRDDSEAIDANERTFGSAMQSILKQESATIINNTLLATHKRNVNGKRDSDSINRGEQRKVKQRKLEKRLLLSKDHRTPQYDDSERRFVKTATRGVVTLFNAVAKQQKIFSDAEKQNDKQAKKLPVATKDSFLQLLKSQSGNSNNSNSSNNGSISISSSTDNNGRTTIKDESDTATAAAPAWSVLSDSYMLGATKMKDWGTNGSSSDEESDAE